MNDRVTAQAIGKYERNEGIPSSGVLIVLAKALKVSVGYESSPYFFSLVWK
jgi:transcriptional regulator with XRE-family HTH domain